MRILMYLLTYPPTYPAYVPKIGTTCRVLAGGPQVGEGTEYGI